MLEINLSLSGDRVHVKVDGAESHSFVDAELSLTDEQLESFALDPAAYGYMLYQALFPIGTMAESALRNLADRKIGLHIEHSGLLTIPWEYLHNGQGHSAHPGCTAKSGSWHL